MHGQSAPPRARTTRKAQQTANVPGAQGLNLNCVRPVALQCIETSAVCNRKMRIGTDSVICSDFGTDSLFREPREDARMRMAQAGRQQSICHRDSWGAVSLERRMRGLQRRSTGTTVDSCNRLRKEDLSFHSAFPQQGLGNEEAATLFTPLLCQSAASFDGLDRI